jgi:hypothetical protein
MLYDESKHNIGQKQNEIIPILKYSLLWAV